MKIKSLFLVVFLSLSMFVCSQNYAFSFVNKTDVITIGDQTEINPPWTAEMWVYRKGNIPSSPGASALLSGKMGKLNLETWAANYKVGISYIKKNDQAFNYVAPLNTWAHLAFVCDGSSTSLYVNGVKNGSITHGMENPAFNLPMSTIGLSGESPNANIDEVRVWNSVRTAKEIQENMNKSVDISHANLYGYWFADNQAKPATDISSQSRSCAVTGVSYVANTNPNFVTNIPDISYKTTVVSHSNSAFVSPGALRQEALLINVQTAGVLGALAVTQINCKTRGTNDLSEIKNARLYSTKGSSTFTSASEFGSVIQSIGEDLTFNGRLTLNPGNNYFWLTYDILSSATQGSVFDGECTSVVVDGVQYDVASPAADGARIIHNPLPASPNAISIIPKPSTMKYNGGSFALTDNTRIVATSDVQNEANQIATFLRRPTGFSLPISNATPKAGDIILYKAVDSKIPAEGYELDVYADSVSIKASTNAGLYYGWQTLRQMFPKAVESSKVQTAAQWNIPCASITDAPRMSFRSFMFDPARYFHSVTFTKKLLDHLAIQKINFFHWHLTEDQGFRFESETYPTLNSIGSWQSNCGNRGGYYTKAEMRDIVKYAQDRHIEIIPEIDIPGHTEAMLASLPVLKCTSAPDHIDVSCKYGYITPNIVCGGQDTTYKIIENILLEFMDIFPSKYFHIGGDEAPKSNWDNCTKCTAFKKANNIANSHDLQAYMTSYFNDFLKKHGRRLIGWEEILGGLKSLEPIAQAWNNTNACYEAMKNGRDVIFSDCYHYYIDIQQVEGDAARGYGYGWAGVNDLSDVYHYDPVLPNLTEVQKSHIYGMEACLWGETLVDSIHTEYMLYPRLFALGEGMWSTPEKDYSDFYTRLANRIAVVDSTNTHYRKLDAGPVVNLMVDTIYTDKAIVLRAKDVSEHYYWSNHSTESELTVSKSGTYSVYYTVGNRMLENKYIVIMGVPNALPQLYAKAKLKVNLYPNPVGDVLNIDLKNEAVKSVRISSLNGQTLLTKNYTNNSNNYSVNVAALPKGTYMAELTCDGNEIVHMKFLKK